MVKTSFRANRANVRAAREWCRAQLVERRDEAFRERVALVASELVANAVLHGAGPVRMALAVDPGRVTLSVGDAGAGPVTPRVVPLDALGGRGLGIVASVSDCWGVRTAVPKRARSCGRRSMADSPRSPPTAAQPAVPHHTRRPATVFGAERVGG